MATVDAPTIRAAGGVVWRNSDPQQTEPGVEVAIIHRPRYDDWSLPKGKLAPGETEIEGAIREVFEETGFRVKLGRPLGEVRYLKTSNGLTRSKVVRYWAMQVETGAFTPNREVDELRWMTLAEADAILTHDHDREILERFLRGPALTGCVLVVRHASAGSRSEWVGDDRMRPLDDHGTVQAEEIVRLLSRYEVSRIVAADFERCIQTVKPLAETLGLQIEEDKLFSEDGYPGNEQQALERIREWAKSLETTVICSQGDVIPDLLDRLSAEDHFTFASGIPSKKGSVWALMFDGEKLFSAEYFPQCRS